MNMASTNGKHGALKKHNPDAILARINAGSSLRQIAAEIGVSNVGLRAWLLRENSEQYADAITNALTLRVAEADEALELAPDAVSIARAREQARFARMDLERRRPGLYGAKPSTAVNINGTDGMNVQIVSYASHTAEQQLLDIEADNRTIIATDTDEAEE